MSAQPGFSYNPKGPLSVRTPDMTAAWRHIDWLIIASVTALTLMGFALIHSASRQFTDGSLMPRQLVFSLMAAGVIAIVAAVDYRRIIANAHWVYLGSLALLAAVLIPGVSKTVNGTQGWFDLGVFQFQPAETAKLAAIVALAALLGGDRIASRPLRLLACLGVVGVPMAMVLVQPDLGSALVFLFIGAGVMFVGGIRGRYLAVLAGIAVLGAVGILNSGSLEDYQKDRLTTFVQPDCPATDDACYNVRQAQIAVSSGGLTGYGYGRGPQTTGQFVPEQETDFIFTVAGEEFGFAGSTAILGLYALLIWRMWYAAMVAPDQQGRLICVGVMCMMMFHLFENIGMSIGMMPVTGIPLPFISYGGSSLITMFAAVGLVLNVHMRQWDVA
ncbi:MAG: rod shape-determining protein RodA [Microthrixaceae bacterium]|nr:rod shape-determining protein RodA [Microthrixaceae bacterium]